LGYLEESRNEEQALILQPYYSKPTFIKFIFFSLKVYIAPIKAIYFIHRNKSP
jgi:hypothetical protein